MVTVPIESFLFNSGDIKNVHFWALLILAETCSKWFRKNVLVCSEIIYYLNDKASTVYS